jgi:hypothetical protein
MPSAPMRTLTPRLAQPSSPSPLPSFTSLLRVHLTQPGAPRSGGMCWLVEHLVRIPPFCSAPCPPLTRPQSFTFSPFCSHYIILFWYRLEFLSSKERLWRRLGEQHWPFWTKM